MPAIETVFQNVSCRMRCDLVPDMFHRVRDPRQGVEDTPAPLFIENLTLYKMGHLGGWFDLSDLDSYSAKDLYGAQVQLLPDLDVQLRDPGTDWPNVLQ